jgi:lysophospholipase L1-like esterase
MIGVGIGPGFGARRAAVPGLRLDFGSAASSYSGLVATTTGSVYLQAAGVPVLATGATNPLWEDLGGNEGGGVHVFSSTVNAAPSPIDFRTSAGWTNSGGIAITNAAVLGPDGLTMAQSVADTVTNDESQVLYLFPGGAQGQYASCWIKDDASNPPNDFFSLQKGNYTGIHQPHYAGWTRVTNYDVAGSATYTGFAPSGTTSVNGATLTGLGATCVWGFQSVVGPLSPPLISSGTAAAAKTLDASACAKAIDKNGALDFQVTVAPGAGDRSGSQGVNLDLGDLQVVPSYFLWSFTTTDGRSSLRYMQGTGGAPGFYTLEVRGVDVGSTPTNGHTGIFGSGQAITLRCWYNPATTSAGIRVSVNGCYMSDVAITASGTALVRPSTIYLGTNGGSSTAAMVGRFTKSPTRTLLAGAAPEFLFLGDSIMGDLGVTYMPVGSWIYTAAEMGTRPGIGSLAVSGNTVQNQLNFFNASAWKTAAVKAVVVQVGINDINTGATAAATIASLQALATAIKTAIPLAKVVLCQLLPCSTFLTNTFGAAYQTKWVAVNDAIAGRGGTPITGVDYRALTGDVGSTLNDGANNIPTGYRLADGLHTNTNGRVANAVYARAGLHSLGLI